MVPTLQRLTVQVEGQGNQDTWEPRETVQARMLQELEVFGVRPTKCFGTSRGSVLSVRHSQPHVGPRSVPCPQPLLPPLKTV